MAVAYYVMHQWLQNFANGHEMIGTSFVMGCMLVGILAFAASLILVP
jgi:hypothetical protein